MTYFSDTGQELLIHNHASDQTCHWADVFKPLAFVVFRDSLLAETLQKSPLVGGRELNVSEPISYARWLSEVGKNGLLNLLNVFIVIYELRGLPVSNGYHSIVYLLTTSHLAPENMFVAQLTLQGMSFTWRRGVGVEGVCLESSNDMSSTCRPSSHLQLEIWDHLATFAKS